MRHTLAALLFMSSAATAQEACVMQPQDMIGLLDRASGACYGLDKDFVVKYMKNAKQECEPKPRHGHSMLGRCMVDAPLRPREEGHNLDSTTVIEILRGDIAAMQSQIDAQYFDYSSQLDEFRSHVPDEPPLPHK